MHTLQFGPGFSGCGLASCQSSHIYDRILLHKWIHCHSASLAHEDQWAYLSSLQQGIEAMPEFVKIQFVQCNDSDLPSLPSGLQFVEP